ncbi:MAG: PQQ-dependent sugar dehydrogenase, partial [Pseudomonadota bacterium]
MIRIRVILLALLFLGTTLAQAEKVTLEDQQEWQVEPGYVFKEDAGEFMSAVGMAFFSQPGDKPSDAKAIVTELRGKIQLITNDGQVTEIRTDEEIMQPEKELPDFDGENGQIGACLSPDEKFLFTTGVYMEGWKKLNKITKWKQKVAGNWSEIEKVTELKSIFNDDTAGKAHQIGHCFVDGRGHLWVGVGDGHNPQSTHLPSHSNGKILRMDLNLKAVKENPFYKVNEPNAIASYVYAMGFR